MYEWFRYRWGFRPEQKSETEYSVLDELTTSFGVWFFLETPIGKAIWNWMIRMMLVLIGLLQRLEK